MENTMQLLFSGFTEEFKVARTEEVLQYRDTGDQKASGAVIEVRRGRKWRVEREVEVAESRHRQKQLVGMLATGRAGLGSFPKDLMRKARGKERHQLIQEEVRADVEEERVSKAGVLRQQGAWTKQLIIFKLTMPCEEHVEKANQRKHSKYQELVEKCQEGGWKTYYEPIEVVCKGFAGASLYKVLKQLGSRRVARNRALCFVASHTDKAKRWL